MLSEIKSDPYNSSVAFELAVRHGSFVGGRDGLTYWLFSASSGPILEGRGFDASASGGRAVPLGLDRGGAGSDRTLAAFLQTFKIVSFCKTFSPKKMLVVWMEPHIIAIIILKLSVLCL